MTVSFQHELASVSPLVNLRMLFRWKGSVWKHIYKELLIWTIIYLTILFLYRSDYFLNAKNKSLFENLARYLDTRQQYIPITFILGFFVDTILSRWSSILINMGYIESNALFVTNFIHGDSADARRLRQTMVRYLCLTQIFVFRDISVPVKKRFPTADSMVDAGFLLREEKTKLDSIKLQYNKYWAPVRWIHAIALEARTDGLITSDLLYCKLCNEIDNFRYNLQLLCNYDWAPLPLVYSQVVFLAVYVHFLMCLISRQFVTYENDRMNDLDPVVPMMTMIEFVFLIGWLKVAQALLNPFGDDDDDLECNYLIDKNSATSFCIVNNYDCIPEIQPDLFWLSRNTSTSTSSTVSRTVKCNLTSPALQNTLNTVASCQYYFDEPINRQSIKLEQYSTLQTNYFLSTDPSNNGKNDEMEIIRL